MRTQIYNKFYTGISQDSSYIREWEIVYSEWIDNFTKSRFVEKSPRIEFSTAVNNFLITALEVDNWYWNKKIVFWWTWWEVYVDKTNSTPTYTLSQWVETSIINNEEAVFITTNTNNSFDVNYIAESDLYNWIWTFTTDTIISKWTLLNFKITTIWWLLYISAWANIYVVWKDATWKYVLQTYLHIWEKILNIFSNSNTIIAYTITKRISITLQNLPIDWTAAVYTPIIIDLWSVIDEQYKYNWVEYIVYDWKRKLWYFNWRWISDLRWYDNRIVTKFNNIENLYWYGGNLYFRALWNPWNTQYTYPFYVYWNIMPNFPKWFFNIWWTYNWAELKNASWAIWVEWQRLYFYYNDWNWPWIYYIDRYWTKDIEWYLITQEFYWQTTWEQQLDKDIIEVKVRWEFTDSYISTYVNWIYQNNEIQLNNNWILWTIRLDKSLLTTNFNSIAFKIRLVWNNDKLYNLSFSYETIKE